MMRGFKKTDAHMIDCRMTDQDPRLIRLTPPKAKQYMECGHCDGKGYVTPRMLQLYGNCQNCKGTGRIEMD